MGKNFKLEIIMKNLNKEDKLGKILFIISIITLLYVSYIGFTKLGMWYDEIYSLGMVKSPFKDFINLKRFLVEGLYVYSDEFSSSYVSNLILELTAELGGEKS